MLRDPAFKKYLKYLSLGVEIAVGLCVPILAGLWLDDKLNTKPWLLITGVLFGISILLIIILRVVKETGESD
ncbi:MAG: AtpZ/AtpI family protein [Balneolaceae bacterium]